MISQKRMFFFDIDNTIFSSRFQTIFPQTLAAIKLLANQPFTILAIATGRNIQRLNVLGELRPYFQHLVLFNGGFTQVRDQIIDEHPFSKEEVQNLIDQAHQNGIKIGMTGLHKEVVSSKEDLINLSLGSKYYTNKNSIVDPEFHLKNKIYQIWALEPNKEKLNHFIQKIKNFQIYLWRTRAGIDIVPKGINKVHGIKKIQALYPEHQLICMGDGANDIDMINYADIGISLENSDYEEIKKNPHLIAPHIEKDKLYDFFQKNNFL